VIGVAPANLKIGLGKEPIARSNRRRMRRHLALDLVRGLRPARDWLRKHNGGKPSERAEPIATLP